jgi:hypothetical protein
MRLTYLSSHILWLHLSVCVCARVCDSLEVPSLKLTASVASLTAGTLLTSNQLTNLIVHLAP